MLESLLRRVLYCGHSTQYSHLVWYVLSKDTCTLKACTSPYGYWCSSMVGWLITWVNCSIAKWSTDKTWIGDVCRSWSRSHCISWSLCVLKWGLLHPFISLCPYEPKISRQYWCHFAWVVWLCRNMKIIVTSNNLQGWDVWKAGFIGILNGFRITGQLLSSLWTYNCADDTKQLTVTFTERMLFPSIEMLLPCIVHFVKCFSHLICWVHGNIINQA